MAGGVSYTQSYREGRGKHAVQEEYLKQVEVLIKNDVDFLIGEVGGHVCIQMYQINNEKK